MIYHITYTDKVPNGHAGGSQFWNIYINPKYKDDRGLLEHEIDHVGLFWTCFIVSLVILAFSGVYFQTFYVLILVPFCFGLKDILIKFKPFLQWAEVRAYRKQLKYPPANEGNIDEYKKLYARFISERYGLDITQEEALKLL
jgi:hypothetical protein